MKVTVIGAGYVGCVSAACLTKLGHDVLVVDTDAFKVRELSEGRSPVLEPGLAELVAGAVAQGKLRASLPSDESILWPDVAIICVSTPSLKTGGIDTRPMQRVFAAFAAAAPKRPTPLVVVVRSTIAPSKLRQLQADWGPEPQKHLRLVTNPEFLRETTAIKDFEKPPFILFGSDDEQAMKVASGLYNGVEAPLHLLDIETSMLVKYASNAYHALKIGFANEMAVVAESVGADPVRTMSIFAEDTILDVSKAYLRPGFAFGGSCLPKDVRALVALGKEMSAPLPLMRAVLESNKTRIDTAAEKIVASGAKSFAMLGLSFKLGTDDLRESPYLILAKQLTDAGIALKIYDPDVDAERLLGVNRHYAVDVLPSLPQPLVDSRERALENVEGIILCKRLLGTKEIEHYTQNMTKGRFFNLEYIR